MREHEELPASGIEAFQSLGFYPVWYVQSSFKKSWVSHLGAGAPYGSGHDELDFVARVGNLALPRSLEAQLGVPFASHCATVLNRSSSQPRGVNRQFPGIEKNQAARDH